MSLPRRRATAVGSCVRSGARLDAPRTAELARCGRPTVRHLGWTASTCAAVFSPFPLRRCLHSLAAPSSATAGHGFSMQLGSTFTITGRTGSVAGTHTRATGTVVFSGRWGIGPWHVVTTRRPTARANYRFTVKPSAAATSRCASRRRITPAALPAPRVLAGSAGRSRRRPRAGRPPSCGRSCTRQ